MLKRLHIDLVFFSFFFSIVFCFVCSLVDKFLSFWVFLELCGMSAIPCFFYRRSCGVHGFYRSLLSYIVMSALSSILMITGIIISGFYVFVFLGFVVKFGLFPFSFWVYRVFSGSKWFFIFLLSVVLKFPIIFFCFLLQGKFLEIVYMDSCLTLLMCSLIFWCFSQRWEYIWCHISLASVSTLIVACFCRRFIVCFAVYFYYFIWSCFCLYYFFRVTELRNFDKILWFFFFLLLITPVSFPLFYKLGVCLAIVGSSFYLLFFWCVYSFSEQFFLYKLCSDYYYSGIYKNWLC